MDEFTRQIEEQEKAGQIWLATAGVLPTHLEPSQEAFKKLGIVFGGRLGPDPFQKAQLPPGWVIRSRPDSSYWSDLIDENGKKRAVIFYKAAFYDKRAVATVVQP